MAYFDPVSTWFVVLLADGIIYSNERYGGESITEYERKHIQQSNEILNSQIRRIKNDYGLILPDMAYEQIQLQIKNTKNNVTFQHGHGQIIIDLDNQNYIINLLEECSKKYAQYYELEEYRKKAEWYKKAAIEAKNRRRQYFIQSEQAKKREIEERDIKKKDDLIVIGIAVLSLLILFLAFII